MSVMRKTLLWASTNVWLRERAMRTGFVPASQPGWWIVAACGAIILILGIVTTGRWALGAAAHRGPARAGQREVTRPDEKRE